jgi:hypothetical protein
VCHDGHYLAGIPADAGCLPNRGQEVVLLIDEGFRFFDLRAISVRGRAEPVAERVEAALRAQPGSMTCTRTSSH